MFLLGKRRLSADTKDVFDEGILLVGVYSAGTGTRGYENIHRGWWMVDSEEVGQSEKALGVYASSGS